MRLMNVAGRENPHWHYERPIDFWRKLYPRLGNPSKKQWRGFLKRSQAITKRQWFQWHRRQQRRLSAEQYRIWEL